MSGTIWITPTLTMGDVPELVDCYRAETAGEALLLIRDRLVAVLPPDSWELAEDVLRALVPIHATVLERLHLARTGHFKALQCNCPSCLAGVTRRTREPDGRLIAYSE
jgi:hypothetical protein